MLTGYRGVILALGLILAGAAPPKEEAKSRASASQVQPSTKPAPDYAPYPDKYAERCYASKDHDIADLCAQWRAAIAAEKAAEAAHWGNLVAGIGAALSFVSIVLIICALRQTEEANRTARDTAKRQLRAYLSIKRVYIKPGDRNVIWVEITNSGQTPAFKVGIESTDCRRPGKSEVMRLGMIGPQSMRHHAFPLASAVGPNVNYDPLAAFTIEYADAFKREWEFTTEFLLNESGTPRLGEWPLHVRAGDWDERETTGFSGAG